MLLAPLGLIALGLLELLFGSAPLGVGLRDRSLAGARPAACGHESDDKERDGDGDGDDDRQNVHTLLRRERGG